MGPRYWIFLRGLSRGQGHWGDFVEKFKEAFPQDQVELIDLPGNGLRHDKTAPLKVSEYVEVMRAESDYIRQGKKVNMLALSLGGMIAVEWQLRYPSDFERVYLVNTSSGGIASMSERFLLSNYPKLIAGLGERDPAAREELVLNMIVNNKERLRALLPEMVEHSIKHPHSPKNFIRQIWAASKVRFPDRAPGKVTVIGSEGDRLVSVNCTKKIAEKWGLKPVLHPWAGHDLPVDDPAWLITHLSS